MRISEAATGVGDSMADVGLAMQRAQDKTEQMKARASAVQELEAAGTFEDLTTLGSGEDDIDRQLRELSSGSAVDSELAEAQGRAWLRFAGEWRALSRCGRRAGGAGGECTAGRLRQRRPRPSPLRRRLTSPRPAPRRGRAGS